MLAVRSTSNCLHQSIQDSHKPTRKQTLFLANQGKTKLLRTRHATSLATFPSVSCLNRSLVVARATLQGQTSKDIELESPLAFLFDEPSEDLESEEFKNNNPSSEGEKFSEFDLKPLPFTGRGLADDSSIHNPLERMNRLGSGWMGVILEWEGVVVPDNRDENSEAWLQLAIEEDLKVPLMFLLKRAEGMKTEQVISEVFCWTRNPTEVRRLASRKDELLAEILGPVPLTITPGISEFLTTLSVHGVPVAITATSDTKTVQEGLKELGISELISTVIGGNDVSRGRPDPEAYLYACQDVERVPLRCVVVGHSNSTIEAAQDVGMKVIALTTTRPAYELASADLVVNNLAELCFVNMKQLFSLEELEEPEPEPELELEYEPETMTQTMTQTLEVDDWDPWR